MKKAAIATFGCKLNQYETQLMVEQLEDEYEFEDFSRECDLYIVNSCAVTSKAAKESRNAVKKAKKINKDAKIIYTGCDSYLEDGLNALTVGNIYKHKIRDVIKNSISDISEETKTYPINAILTDFKGKSRAFVKIQEGCNNHCTYCIIPKLRGKERDKDMELVLKEIENLSHSFSEVVLTGTNIGSYRNFKGLLKSIDKMNLNCRIRISSIEPMYVDNELIDIVSSGNFAKHLHVPLQSGSDYILKLMGRDYKAKDFGRIIETCYKKGIFTGTDVIVGFFGEDEKRFEETCRFIESLPLTFGHVFSYSKRPNTAACNINMQLERGPVIKMRNAELTELFRDKFKKSVKSMVGKKTTVVTEPTIVERDSRKFYRAVASEYFPVLVDEQSDGLREVVINGFDGEYAYA